MVTKRNTIGVDKFRRLSDEYFLYCRQKEQHPSLPGLALALGLNSRQELDQIALQRGTVAEIVRAAITQVEEANVQSLYKKDYSQGAKFILQSTFSYTEKPAPPADDTDEIIVNIQGEQP